MPDKCYIVTNKLGKLIGVFRRKKDADAEAEKKNQKIRDFYGYCNDPTFDVSNINGFCTVKRHNLK